MAPHSLPGPDEPDVLPVLDLLGDPDETGAGRTKSGKWREVPLNRYARWALRHLPDPLVKVHKDTVSDWFAKDAAAAGIGGHLHPLRQLPPQPAPMCLTDRVPPINILLETPSQTRLLLRTQTRPRLRHTFLKTVLRDLLYQELGVDDALLLVDGADELCFRVVLD